MWLAYITLASLGIASIDPIGIGLMPLLMAQKRPFKRSLIFLFGSFAALVVFGYVLARGLGKVILSFEQRSSWFLPTVEAVAGLILLVVAISVLVQLNRGHQMQPSKLAIKWIRLDRYHLFFLGFGLVAIQSLLDVVFVVTMVRLGQFSYSNARLLSGVTVYAIAALLIQGVLVIVYKLAPFKLRNKLINKTSNLLVKLSSEALVVIALILSLILFGLALSHY